MSLLQLEVGVSSTHGFVGDRCLFEQRFAELSAALNGYGDHDVGDRGQRTVLTGGDRQDSRATVGSAPGEVQRNGGFLPDADSISRQSPWPIGVAVTSPVRCTSNPTCMSRIAGMLATGRYRPWPDTNHRRVRSANASVSSTSLSWSTSLSVLVISS